MIRKAAALFVFVLAVLLSGGVAYAHGGPIKLDAHGDGGQGVNVTVTYKNDGHMVPDEVHMTYTAISSDKQTIGPVKMVASAEGQSFYTSAEPLPVGNWTVTVTATHPSPAQQTIAVTSKALPVRTAATIVDDGPDPVLVTLSIAVPAVLAGVAFFVLRRRPARR
jgi:hypothetical protein